MRTLLPLLISLILPATSLADCVTDADCTGDGEVCVEGVCQVAGNSCWGRCGGAAPDCYCDHTCDLYGDCCADLCEACPDAAPCCQGDCTDKDCGDDGCGGSCGLCDLGLTCDEGGHCAPCAPDCGDKVCGDDGCGGSCGGCDSGLTCASDGSACLDCGSCAPWDACDEGACVPPSALAPCPMGGDMIAATCHDISQVGCCAGAALYYCESAATGGCPPGVEDCLCQVDCDPDGDGGLTCGWWEQLFICTPPPAQSSPDGALECGFYQCPPNCTGRVCGDDGCGGSCGSCAGDEACSPEGLCLSASCQDLCGDVAPSGCWCDQHCEEAGDCCEDRCDACPYICGDDPCPGACEGHCGQVGDCDCGGCGEGEVCEDTACVPMAAEDVITGEDTINTDGGGADAPAPGLDTVAEEPCPGTGGGGCAAGQPAPTGWLLLLLLALLCRYSFTEGTSKDTRTP